MMGPPPDLVQLKWTKKQAHLCSTFKPATFHYLALAASIFKLEDFFHFSMVDAHVTESATRLSKHLPLYNLGSLEHVNSEWLHHSRLTFFTCSIEYVTWQLQDFTLPCRRTLQQVVDNLMDHLNFLLQQNMKIKSIRNSISQSSIEDPGQLLGLSTNIMALATPGLAERTDSRRITS